MLSQYPANLLIKLISYNNLGSSEFCQVLKHHNVWAHCWLLRQYISPHTYQLSNLFASSQLHVKATTARALQLSFKSVTFLRQPWASVLIVLNFMMTALHPPETMSWAGLFTDLHSQKSLGSNPSCHLVHRKRWLVQSDETLNL